MEKTSLIVTAGICIALSAVSSMAVEASVCIRAGLGISNISGDDADSFSYSLIEEEMERTDFELGQERSVKEGLICGMGIDWKFNDVVGAETDLLYNVKGFNQAITTWYFIDPSQHNDADATGTLHYLEMPLLLKIMAPWRMPVRPFFITGPSFGILLSSKVHYTIKYYTGWKDTTVNFREGANTLDLGWTFGTGTEIPAGSGKFILNFHYAIGLVPFTSDPASVKNRQIILTVGYAFKPPKQMITKRD